MFVENRKFYPVFYFQKQSKRGTPKNWKKSSKYSYEGVDWQPQI